MYTTNQFDERKAKHIATVLAESDPDWLYLVVPSDGMFKVAIFDENKLFLAYWFE